MLQTMKINSDGVMEQIKPFKHKRFSLQEQQAAVNGFVEMHLIYDHGVYLIYNEEGKMLKLPMNEMATKIFRDAFGEDAGTILGDVLVAQINEID